MAEGDLTDRQRAFVEIYLTCWNATEAARRAGYSGDANTLGVTGYDNLRNPKIASAVKARLAELHITADEVLARLADQARASMEDFLTIGPKGGVKVDLAKAARNGKLHLLHRYSKGKGGIVAFELYDVQTALVQLAKLLGLYPAEKMDVNLRAIDQELELQISLVAAKRTAVAGDRLNDAELKQLSDLLTKAGDGAGPTILREGEDEATDT